MLRTMLWPDFETAKVGDVVIMPGFEIKIISKIQLGPGGFVEFRDPKDDEVIDDL